MKRQSALSGINKKFPLAKKTNIWKIVAAFCPHWNTCRQSSYSKNPSPCKNLGKSPRIRRGSMKTSRCGRAGTTQDGFMLPPFGTTVLCNSVLYTSIQVAIVTSVRQHKAILSTVERRNCCRQSNCSTYSNRPSENSWTDGRRKNA